MKKKLTVYLKFLVDYKKLSGEQRYKNKVLLKVFIILVMKSNFVNKYIS